MFEKYLASEVDLRAVEEALGCVLCPKMKFVFADFSKLKNTHVISFDSKFVYVWKIKPIKLIYKIGHGIKVLDNWQQAWHVGVVDNKLESLLPSSLRKKTRFTIPLISGGLLTPFLNLQSNKTISSNPYTTKESYLATVIHEFGHIYWNQHKLWWFSDKKTNIDYINVALKFQKPNSFNKNLSLSLPIPTYFSEVYAFCTEYYASSVFFPEHKKNLDRFMKERFEKMKREERIKNLEIEDSVIEPNKHIHDFSLVFGKIILSKHPNSWPKKLTKLQINLGEVVEEV